MTCAAAGTAEQAFPRKRGLSGCERCIARRSLGTADELREVIDVGQAKTIRHVLRVLRQLANGCRVFWAQTTGHSHFVQVRICDKREQTAMLVFPAETTDPCLA